MKLDFTEKGKVKVDMVDYTREIIDGILEEITGGAATPAATHVFEIDPDCEALPEELACLFQRCVAKLLFFMQTSQAGYTGTCSVYDNKSKKTHTG